MSSINLFNLLAISKFVSISFEIGSNATLNDLFASSIILFKLNRCEFSDILFIKQKFRLI